MNPSESQPELALGIESKPKASKAERAAVLAKIKDRFEFLTMRDCDKLWLAFSRSYVEARLDIERDDNETAFDVWARYCRYLSECNIIIEDAKTEWQAVQRSLELMAKNERWTGDDLPDVLVALKRMNETP